MEQVLRLAENYMMQRVMGGHSPLSHVTKAMMVLSVICGVLGALSIGFMLFGAFLWLSQNFPMHEAYMIFGALLLGLSVLTLMTMSFIQARKRQKMEAFKNRMRDELLLNLKLAEQELSDLKIMENNPKTCLALASLAGFALSEKIYH